MTKFIPLGDSKFDSREKVLKLMGGHLEENILGNLSVAEGDTTIYGEIEVKSDGSYELMEEGLSSRNLSRQEKTALKNRVLKQWEDSKKYSRFQDIKEDVIGYSIGIGVLLSMSAAIGGSRYLIEEISKYLK